MTDRFRWATTGVRGDDFAQSFRKARIPVSLRLDARRSFVRVAPRARPYRREMFFDIRLGPAFRESQIQENGLSEASDNQAFVRQCESRRIGPLARVYSLDKPLRLEDLKLPSEDRSRNPVENRREIGKGNGLLEVRDR